MHRVAVIYGATGYTGALVARRAREAGLRPVLAGRSAGAVAARAAALDLPWRAFPLDDPAAVRAGLDGAAVLLNAAGPFEETAPPLLDACLAAGVHYADLAGEVPAFLAAQRRDAAARAAGVMVLPGAGFGVVATDVAAALAAASLGDGVTAVDLAFRTEGGVSRGTAGGLLPGLHRPGVTREAGALVAARPASRSERVDLGDGRPRRAVLSPWRADLVTAAVSTGAPTVTTFQSLPAPLRVLMRAGGPLGPVLDSRAWQGLLGAVVRRLPDGPGDAQLAAGRVLVRAEARDGRGRRSVAFLRGPEAYEFTARSAVAVLGRALDGDAPAGFRTPVTAYGTGLVDDLAGVEVRVLPVAVPGAAV